jgi:hypothetical protein
VLLLYKWTRGNLLAIVAFTSIFDGASALNFGSLGIAPWVFALALCLPVRIFERKQRQMPAGPIGGFAAHGLAAYFVLQVLSGVVYPVLFSGVLVARQADLVSLSWGMPNAAQLCYLSLSALLLFLTIVSGPNEVPAAVAWYVRGCIVAALVAGYQLLHATLHLPYPDAILYSNSAHTVYHAYTIGGVWRLNSTFTEASDMAGSLIGGLAILVWNHLHLPFKASRLAAIGLIAAAILSTLSTTGYLCLATLGLAAALLAAQRIWQQRQLSVQAAAAGLLCVLASTSAFVLSPSLRSTCANVLNVVALDKQNSDSYQASVESHQQALRTLRETSYLGAGLGSTRARGLFYTLLAGSGVPGLLSFVFAIGALFLAALQREWRDRESASPGIVLAIFLILVAMTIAGSEPVYPVFWLFFGACLKPTNPARRRSSVAPFVPSIDMRFRLRAQQNTALASRSFGAHVLATGSTELRKEAGCS